MNPMALIRVILLFLLIFYNSSKTQTKFSIIEIPYSSQAINLDGDLLDWDTFLNFQFGDTLEKFTSQGNYDLKVIYPPDFDFSKINKPKSKNKVNFYSFWNNVSLFFAFEVKDQHLFAEIASKIDKPRIHMNDGIEIYIDTKNDSPSKMDVNDYQFIIDILGEYVVFRGDRREILIDEVAVPKDFDQNVLFKTTVSVKGTINDDSDLDSSYTIEIEIPFAAIGMIPETGHQIKLDICINDVDYFEKEGIIIEEISSNNWTFNWSGYSDFGYPEYWKPVQLTGSPSWFENISEEYRKSWFWIYILTLFSALTIIFYLFYRTIKLKRLPRSEEISEDKFIFIQSSEDKSLSQNEMILKNASDFIAKNRSEIINSEQLSNALNISLRNLQRITRSELSLTPTNYIYVIKLKLAEDFLRNKEGNVTDAAYEFGFSDPSYFSKIFKRYFGQSPSEFVKNSYS